MWKHDTFRERKCQTQQSVSIQHSLYLHLWATLDPQLFICTQKGYSSASSFLASHCIPVSPAVLNCCSQREFTLFSPTSPHILPQRALLPMVSPCNPVPFPTVLQTSVLRRARGNKEGAQKRCCREEWVSQQLESQRHWRERKQLIL